MNTYHPEFDKPDAYLKAAEAETDPVKKLLLQRAAATISYMGKHMNATINLLCKINNDIVNALGDDGDYLDAEDMSDYLPDIRAAIEHCDDIKEKFHTPYSEWKHLCDEQPKPEIVDSPTISSISWNKASELGLIEKINRNILHKLGLAMSRNPTTGFSEGLLVADDGVWEYSTKMQTTILPDEEVIKRLRSEFPIKEAGDGSTS